MTLKRNIGKIDKWIRIVSGIALVAAGYYFQSWLLGIAGVIIFGTGIIDWCLIYKLLGVSTCKTETPKEETNREDTA